MDANQIIGELMAEEKYFFADKVLLSCVVRDVIKRMAKKEPCEFCDENVKYPDIMEYCPYCGRKLR